MCQPWCWWAGRCWREFIGSANGGMKWLLWRLASGKKKTNQRRYDGRHKKKITTKDTKVARRSTKHGGALRRFGKELGYDGDTSSENHFVAGDCGGHLCGGAVCDLRALCAGVQPVDAPNGSAALGTVGWVGNIVRRGTVGGRVRHRGGRVPVG